MFFKATINQTAFLLRRKGAVCVFYILLGIVSLNFIRNVLEFQGGDVTQMYHPMKLLALSYNRINYNADILILLVQLYPLLVVVPAGFSLAGEYRTGERVYMTARLGRRVYMGSRLMAAFLATFIIFTVPMLLEIILNCISFPLEAACDLSNLSFYSRDYIDGVHRYLMAELYIFSPYLYAVAGTVLFGVISGMLGCFTAAFSAVVRVKYQVFLFLPVFLLLNATVFLNAKIPKGLAGVSWYDYLFLFNDNKKEAGYLLIGVLGILCFIFLALSVSGRKDCV